MKKAFRIMGLCALVALAATACKKEAQTTSSFKATLTQPTSEAKTHLGSDSYLYWNEGDAIKVFDAQGNDYLFTTTENNVTTATFNGTDPIDVNGSYTAFYPAANVEKVSNDILLTLPATQDYAEGTFGNATYPMAAEYSADGFTFHSPCGLLAIPVKGTGNLGSIELTSKINENLAGQLRYNLSGAYQSLDNAQTKVTLECGNMTLNPDAATTFYFVLPAGVFANGFTAVLKNGDTELYTLETTKDNAIIAEHIMLMPEVEVQAIAVTTSAATGISKTAATLNGSYELPTTAQGMNVTEVGFYFGTDASAMTATQATLGTPFSLAKEGLTEGTTYYYKAYAKNGTREYEGPVLSFATLSDPTVSTGAAAATTATTATGHVTLTNAGSGTVTELGLCWGTSANPTVSNNHAVAAGQEVGTEYAINITGLTAGAQYYVRGYAKVGEEYYYAANSATFSTVWNGNLGMLSNSDPADFATATDGMTIYGTLNANVKISIVDDGATVTLNNATITGTNDAAYSWAGINCENNTTLVIEGANSVTGFYENYPGIFIASGKTLTIEGNGSLDVSSNGGATGWGAGIGSDDVADCGNIVINSGTISATGGIWMAGIGCGYAQNCGYITINGGTVTATGGIGAAGIGTGYGDSPLISCGNISITGGIVNATGGLGAAGIGSGFVVNNKHNQCGNISITGGQVTATGGDGGNGAYPDILDGGAWANIPYYGGAGIGTGSTTNYAEGSSSCGTITIGSGVTSVTATKGSGTYPATNSIGKNHSGNPGTCGTITIGGTVYPSGATPNQGDGLTFVYPVPEPPTAPAGAINGLFSVSATQQVWFSQGNLLNTGYFADNQYDYGGLLQWAASFTSNYSGDWRALTSEEWNYLLTDRANASNLWGFANVEYSNGIILLPDGSSLSINTDHSAWENNSIDNTTWSEMEANGAVFLPAAGYLDGSSPEDTGKKGYYWCSTSGGYMSFGKSGSSFEVPTCYVGGGGRRSVRLVINVQ